MNGDRYTATHPARDGIVTQEQCVECGKELSDVTRDDGDWIVASGATSIGRNGRWYHGACYDLGSKVERLSG